MDDIYMPSPPDDSGAGGARGLDRWLGDGGMPLLGHMGVSIDGFDGGRSWASWVPTVLCCNPRGAVQAGVYTVVLDATMSVAMLSVLSRDHMAVSLDIYTTTMEPALAGDALAVSAQVVRQGSTTIFAAATASDGAGKMVAEARGTYAVRRRPNSSSRGGARATRG